MKLEELIRIHSNIVEWLGHESGHIFQQAFTHSELADLTKFIPVPEKAARTMMPYLPLPEEIADHSGRLTTLSIYTQCDLQRLRDLPVSSKEEVVAQMRGGNRAYAIFHNLSLPFEKDARDAALVEMFGPLYEALNKKAAEQIKEVESKDATRLVSDFEKTAKLDAVKRVLYAWAVLVSSDELKHPLAAAFIDGQLASTPEIIEKQIPLLYRKIRDLERERRDAERKASGYQRKLAPAETELGAKRRELSDAQARISELEKAVAERPVERVEVVPDDVKKLMEEAQTWESLASVYEGELEVEKKRRAQLEAKLAQLGVKEEKNGGISNGTGITVYAVPELRERYAKMLCSYTNPNLNKPFPEVIDETIKRICRRIKDGGVGILRTEFFYMADLHFIKLGNGTRVFFTTDGKSRLTIYDVITPDEHLEQLHKKSGRYAAIIEGRASYTTDERKHVKLEKTVRELENANQKS